jgi:hypothetical protein
MKTGSRQVDHVLNEVPHGGKPKIEPIPYAVDLEKVEDLGSQDYYGRQPTGPNANLHSGPGYKNTPGVSVNPTCGPGGGRTVLRNGSQGRR